MAEVNTYIDFISLLPPEILVIVLVYVPLKNVLLCLRVCSQWNIKITELDSYWREALKSLGVSRTIYDSITNQSKYLTHRDVVMKVYKTREYISRSQPIIKILSPSYPSNLYFQCNYSKYGVLVGTIYEQFVPLTTVVYSIKPNSGLLKRLASFQPLSQDTFHRIVWSHLYCEYLVLASASGIWRTYNLATGKNVLCWQGPTLYEPDLIVGCCEGCYMIVIGKMVSHWKPKETYWEIQIIHLGRGCGTAPTLTQVKLDVACPIQPLATEYGSRNVGIISHSRLCDSNGFCQSHWLLLQWADTVHIYEIDYISGISMRPYAIFSSGIDISTVQLLTLDKHCSTEFVISSDQTLLGYIFSGSLYIWSLCSGKLEAKVSVKLKKKVQIRLLSIGHLYTVIGYETVEGQLQVISTYTGKMVFGTHGFAGIQRQTLGTPPPYFTFLSMVDEEWLNKIDALPHPSLPVLLYWDKLRHCVAGISFYHDTLNSVDHVQSTPDSNTVSHIGFKERLKNILHF